MTSGHEAARQGMQKSVDDNRQQVAMTDESRRLLADLLEERTRTGVEEGIKAAMTSVNARLFMRSLITEAQAMASEKSVEVVGSALKAIAMKAFTFVVLGCIVYWVGGWAALGAMVKWLIEHRGAP